MVLKALIWNILNTKRRMAILAFFKKISWPSSSVFFMLLCAAPADRSSRAAGTAYCPRSALEGRKSLGGIVPRELSYFTPLCSLQHEIRVRGHFGEQRKEKTKLTRVNPRVQKGFVYSIALEHDLEQPWGGSNLWFDNKRKRRRPGYSHQCINRIRISPTAKHSSWIYWTSVRKTTCTNWTLLFLSSQLQSLKNIDKTSIPVPQRELRVRLISEIILRLD